MRAKQELIMRTTFALALSAAFALMPTAALAQPGVGSISPHHATGQPGVTCGEDDALNSPGNAADAPGSAFNEDGGIAGSVYAGEQDQNSKNTASVSQYDVACLHAQSGG
jgi:hypothetical protein